MANIIIGTAGHIDHGKTTLIKALTGKNTDRLKEEQKRGISIELGFTYFDLPDGRRAGIIDVPGHERFIKNMLAGVGGMDLVLLVIAADEGVMPQTREHLNILNLIRISKGIIVLTKADLVEDEWLQMVQEEVREEVKNTFLENAPIIPVSSTTGQGMDILVSTINNMTKEVAARNTDTIYRVNVDRAFSITGFGTIITGTLLSGRIEEGQRVCIYPAGTECRVRNIQVHDQDVKTAFAGQRVAINLAGIKLEQVSRGDVIAPPDVLQPTMMMDCRIELVEGTDWSLSNRDRVRLHLGTKELLCRVTLLDKDELKPGESCFAQLRLEEEAVALRGDRFVIRSYSPMETIGGGVILEPNPPKRKRFNGETIEELRLKESGSPLEVLEKVLSISSSTFPGRVELAKSAGMGQEEIKPLLEGLKIQGSALELNQGGTVAYIHRDYYKKLRDRANNMLSAFHSKFPLRKGMSVEEFRRKLVDNIKGPFIDELLRRMEEAGDLEIKNQTVSLSGYRIVFNERQKRVKDGIISLLEAAKYSPPSPDEIATALEVNREEMEEVADALWEAGEIRRLKDGVLILETYYQSSVQAVTRHIDAEGSITLSTFRDMLGTSRKYAMALLEEMDREKITKWVGDHRVLNR
ncbi:MAG: selenocysteine-specific translation elongation factor [Bacillota bacterium]|nr:selenocysteine-specific translation elongation factor [Bacillota bacterium]